MLTQEITFVSITELPSFFANSGVPTRECYLLYEQSKQYIIEEKSEIDEVDMIDGDPLPNKK